MAAMDREAAFRELEAVYAELERDLGALGPKCELSGRCCRFGAYGHQLWTTTLELEYLLDRHPIPEEIPDGACPYQREGRCSVRDRRMLGCRVFFCDPAFKDAMGPLYERHHGRIRELHRRHGVAYACFEFLEGMRRRCGRAT